MNPAQQPLSSDQLHELLQHLSAWQLDDGKLTRTWSFPDFIEAMKFVGRVAELAESQAHHPDIDIRYNRVKLGLISHDAGGITNRDAEIARLLDSLPG
jgi:4a-hydroxytetrahydrobiopterin dehydratase